MNLKVEILDSLSLSPTDSPFLQHTFSSLSYRSLFIVSSLNDLLFDWWLAPSGVREHSCLMWRHKRFVSCSSSAGNLGWNRNMAGQQRAHQSNAGRQERDYDHYAGQGRSTSGGRDYNSRGSGYRPPPDRGYDTYRTGAPARPPGGYDSYRTGAPGPERGGYQGRPSDRQDEYQRVRKRLK